MKPASIVRARVLHGMAALAVVATLAAAGWHGYHTLVAHPMERIVFQGDAARLAPEDLESLARDVRGATSLAAVQQRARAVPWVRDVQVRRQYPDTVEIRFEVHQVLARWGDDALVSTRGEVFAAPHAGELPRLRGPDGAAATMSRELPAIAAALAPLASPVAELRLSARGAWQVALESGLELELGRGDFQPRIARFVAAWPKLADQNAATRHADLRHANGFAVRRTAELTVLKPTARAATRKPKQPK
jgi:cell division protein FtsQ